MKISQKLMEAVAKDPQKEQQEDEKEFTVEALKQFKKRFVDMR